MSVSPVLDFMHKRRSVLARTMVGPGPKRAALDAYLTAAARVPDHGKLTPWRFVVLEGDDRAALGEIAAQSVEADLQPAARVQFERAPCVVAVLFCPVAHPKIPTSEQLLSAGAACMSLLSAAQADGWAAQWLTGAAAYDPAVKARLGGREEGAIAGFIYIGSKQEAPAERPRPALDEVVQFGLSDTHD